MVSCKPVGTVMEQLTVYLYQVCITFSEIKNATVFSMEPGLIPLTFSVILLFFNDGTLIIFTYKLQTINCNTYNKKLLYFYRKLNLSFLLDVMQSCNLFLVFPWDQNFSILLDR